ncbi:MAG: hypothetical protein K6L81_16015 [Agarilytica sp.]
MYKELRYNEVIDTISKLEERIKERFPESGIGKVCEELGNTASGAQTQILTLSQPNKWIRAGVIGVVTVFLIILGYTISIVDWELSRPNLTEMIQITEALINDILLVGAALFFLITFEQRIKRRSVLQALHQLRSIAHVVDMHQLTKDPAMLNAEQERTENSPQRCMSAFELQRYLDYCSEMFSLISKIAAMFSEKLPEPEIVSAANEIENLCTGLSRKVWQKMVFLDNR